MEPDRTDAATLLADVCDLRAAENAAAAALLDRAARWADLHPAVDPATAATSFFHGVDTGAPLAGDGTPAVAASCVAELAAALHCSTEAGRNLIGEALKLRHRLPRLWRLVHTGRVPAWQARRVATRTMALTRGAAGFVDDQVAAMAGRVGPTQLDRLITTAVLRHMPEEADLQRRAAQDSRCLDVHHDHDGTNHGLAAVTGWLDLPDALDLDAAVSDGAQALARAGCAESLDVRRSMALGELARRQPALDLGAARAGTAVLPGGSRADGPGEDSRVLRPTDDATSTARRRVTLYLHLSAEALTPGGHATPGRVGNTQVPVTAEQIRDWCGQPGGTVTVRPVIDLDRRIAVDQYEVPDRIREHIALRDRTCVFPWCHRPAHPRPVGHPGADGDSRWSLDCDHTIAYAAGGATATDNTAPLCRTHHQLKTHHRWRCTSLALGRYLWTSPHGPRYVRDRDGGTTEVPREASPPAPADTELDPPPDRRPRPAPPRSPARGHPPGGVSVRPLAGAPAADLVPF